MTLKAQLVNASIHKLATNSQTKVELEQFDKYKPHNIILNTRNKNEKVNLPPPRYLLDPCLALYTQPAKPKISEHVLLYIIH